MSVEHILAAKGHSVVTIQPERTLAEAARLLNEKRIGAVVVQRRRSCRNWNFFGARHRQGHRTRGSGGP